MGKALAKNPDTGGITYWLTHSHKGLGEKRYDIFANHPLACAYTDTISGQTIYAVYNVGTTALNVHFFGAKDTTVTVPHGLTLISDTQARTITTIEDEEDTTVPDPMAWDLPYPNLALHKPVTASSEENDGCLKAFLTDGDLTTRWGSAHQDDEYVIVDLQQTCYIDYLILRWEVAFASEYELAFSDDQINWNTAIYSSAGGVETVYTRIRGRYIRLTGLKRATTYGTSIYELEAYGRPLTGDPDKIFSLALSATDTVLYQGQTTTLTTTAYSYNGDILSTTDEQLSYSDYGLFIVTRTIEGCSASLTFVVLEIEQTVSVVVNPDEVIMPLGDTQCFDVCPINQFGIATDTCHFDFRATQVGDSVLSFDCYEQTATATAHVLPYSEVNLALNKPVTTSGYENAGTKPEGAVDGDFTTRWGSKHQDDEWLEIDLEHCYILDSIRLYWETAYATAYEILVSNDAINYESVYSTTTGNGGNETIRLSSLNGQFVRILCHKRHTGYGSSLWEVQVYGSGRCDDPTTAINDILQEKNTYIFIKDGQIYISRNGTIYSIDGRVLMHAQER